MSDTKNDEKSRPQMHEPLVVTKKGDYMMSTYLLALCWAWTLSASTLFMFVCTISAKTLVTGHKDGKDTHLSDAQATFTFGTYLIGASLSSIPSDAIFKKMGRKGGFLFGCFLQILGSVFGCISMAFNNVAMLFLGSIFVGLGQGFGQFYRFAAVETAPPDKKSWAITIVLSGGILAAFIGPSLAIPGQTWLTKNYLGCYIIMVMLGCVNFITVNMITFDESKIMKKGPAPIANPNAPTFCDVVSQPVYVLSVTIATIAQSIMIMLMSNCALEMQNIGFSYSTTSLVFNLHFLAMYGPGFLTAKLIAKYGTFAVAFLGTVIYTFSLLVGVFSIKEWAFFVEMIFLGLAWNFSFTAGTVMLTSCYPPEYTTACQGLNDVFVFGVSGILAICSGIIVQEYGWNVQIFLCFALLFCFILMFAIAYNAKLVVKDKEEQRTSSVPMSTSNSKSSSLPANSGIHPDVLATINDDEDYDPEDVTKPSTSYNKSAGGTIRPSNLNSGTIRQTQSSQQTNYTTSRISLAPGANPRQTMSRLTLTGGLARNTMSGKSASQRFFTNEGMEKDVVDALSGAGDQEDESMIRASMGGF